MKRNSLWSAVVVALVCGCVGTAVAADNVVKVISEVKTTFGWNTMTDQTGTRELKLVEGPTKDVKGLQMSYEFKDSLWIAINREISFALGPDDSITFSYDGSGASLNLWVKIFDSTGNAAGYVIPTGSVTQGWQTVSVPRGAFEYLWGPSPSKTVNFEKLTKFELTLDVAERSGSSYSINKEEPGKIAFSNITITNPNAKPSGKKTTKKK
jgi:hypothetical protein